MNPFSSTFWALTVYSFSFFYLKIFKIHFHGVWPLFHSTLQNTWIFNVKSWDWNSRSSRPELLLWKGVLKICSKFTGEHPYRNAISIKLLCNFNWNHTLAWVFSCKFAVYFQHTFFLRTPLNGCFLNFVLFRSGNIYSKERKKKTGFTFSIKLRTIIVWSHDLDKLNDLPIFQENLLSRLWAF